MIIKSQTLNQKRVLIFVICLCMLTFGIIAAFTYILPNPDPSIQTTSNVHVSSLIQSRIVNIENQLENDSNNLYCKEYKSNIDTMIVEINYSIAVNNEFKYELGIWIETNLSLYFEDSQIDSILIQTILFPNASNTILLTTVFCPFSELNTSKLYNISSEIICQLSINSIITTYREHNIPSIANTTSDQLLTFYPSTSYHNASSMIFLSIPILIGTGCTILLIKQRNSFNQCIPIDKCNPISQICCEKRKDSN